MGAMFINPWAPSQGGRRRMKKRNLEVCADRAAGLYYSQIAKKHGISITRVRQILEVWGKQ